MRAARRSPFRARSLLLLFIVTGLLSSLGASTSRADELFDDKAIQGVLGSDACPADSKIEGPPEAGLPDGDARDWFSVKRITGRDLAGEFCLIESLRLRRGASQAALALYRRDNGPWRKVEEAYNMIVLETRTNGYPDISLPYWPPGKPRAATVWRPHVWDGQKYQAKYGPPSSLSGLSRYDGYNGVVSDGGGALLVVGAQETDKQGESVGFLRLVRGALEIDFGIAPPNVTSSAYVDVIRLSDGDVVIVGWQRSAGALTDDCSVVRTSPEGKTRWRQVLGGSSHERCYFVSELPSGELFVGGRTELSTSGKDAASGAVWRLNARTGSPTPSGAATIRAEGVKRSAFQDAAVLADGSVILVGWATDPDRGDDDIWLAKQDPAGRFVWERRIGEEGADLATSVVTSADGDALVVGYRTKKGAASTSGMVMTVGADGNPGWMREFDVGPAGNDKLHHSALLPDGSLMAVGAASKDAKAPFVGWLVHLDRAGKLLKEWLIEEPPGGRLNGVARVKSGGLVAVGSARDVARSDVDGWIIEIDGPPSQVASTAPSGTLQPVVAAGDGEQTSVPDVAALQTALDGLVSDLRNKINHDIETVADAFWAVHEIERARRLADIFSVPFTALNLAISTLSQITNVQDIITQFPTVAAGSWLSAGAYVAGLGAVEDAGGNLRWALDGPFYWGRIKQMYDRAATSVEEQDFKNVIKKHLDLDTWIKAPPGVVGRYSAKTSYIPKMTFGTSMMLGSTEQAIDAIKGALVEHASTLDAAAIRHSLVILKDIRANLLASQVGTVRVSLPGASDQPAAGELVMGSIAELLKVHANVLGRYDADLNQQQITVTVDAAKSAGRALLLGLSFGSGNALTSVQSTVLAVDSLTWTGAKHVFQTDVRSLVAEVPQQMVSFLGNEFSNAWQLGEAALAEVQRTLKEHISPVAHQTAPAASPATEDAPEHECDRLAADPFDERRKTEGVVGEQIKLNEALRACTTAVAKSPGIARFHFQLARALIMADKTDEAVAALKNAAAKNYPSALAYIGMAHAHLNQISTKPFKLSQDYQQSRQLLEKACSLGNAMMGCFGVQLHYYIGLGVTKNESEAAAWFRKAADLGDPWGQLEVAYKLPNSAAKDVLLKKAFSGFERLALLGLAVAQSSLGYMYEEGLGVVKNTSTAIAWYERAASQGHEDARKKVDELRDPKRVADGQSSGYDLWIGRLARQSNDISIIRLEWSKKVNKHAIYFLDLECLGTLSFIDNNNNTMRFRQLITSAYDSFRSLCKNLDNVEVHIKLTGGKMTYDVPSLRFTGDVTKGHLVNVNSRDWDFFKLRPIKSFSCQMGFREKENYFENHMYVYVDESLILSDNTIAKKILESAGAWLSNICENDQVSQIYIHKYGNNQWLVRGNVDKKLNIVSYQNTIIEETERKERERQEYARKQSAQEAREQAAREASALTHSKDTGRRLSLARMVSAGWVQTKGLALPLCSRM